MKKRTRTGSLNGDLAVVAVDIQQALTGASVVWADDIGDVFVAPISDFEPPTHWIIGIFMFGTVQAHVEDDLSAMRRERAKNWIVDHD